MSGRMIGARLAAAQARADAARARLGGTIGELKQRVSPQALAHDAAESLKDQGVAIALNLAEAVKRRPATLAAVAGGLAVFLLRHRIAALARRATGSAPESLPSEPHSKKGPAQ